MRAPSGISSPARPVRVAAAVPALVAGAHDAGHAGELGGGADDALADDRVLAHVLPLVLGELARGVQDRVGDRDLADVVQRGGAADLEQLGVVEAELAPDGADEVGDVLDVLVQLAVVLGGDPQQHLVDGLVAGAPAAALVGVHALVGAAQRVDRVLGRIGDAHRAVGAAHVKAPAGLTQRVGGALEQGRVAAAGEQAELVAAHPVGATRRCPAPRAGSRRGGPSSASPAGWPKVSL